MSRKTEITIQVGIFLLGLLGNVYVAVTPANSMMQWYNTDDAFYYYKVAQNVLTGHGFTFDQINLTNGFHPLWMMVCLGVFWLSRYNLLLPLRVLILVSGLLNSLSGVMLFRLLKKSIHPAVAVTGAAVWILFPSIFSITTIHGMETGISAFFLILFLNVCATYIQKEPVTLQPWQLIWMGFVGALTILSRLDNVFLVGVVGIFTVYKIRKVHGALLLDWLAICLAGFFAVLIRLGSLSLSGGLSVYPMIAAGVVIIPIILTLFGFYSTPEKSKPWKFILRSGMAAFTIFISEFMVLWGLNRIGIVTQFSRSILAINVFFAILLIALFRSLSISRTESGSSLSLKAALGWISQNFKNVLVKGFLFSIPIIILISGYLAANKLMFGTFTPVSGQIKQWWGTLPNTVYQKQTTFIDIVGLSPNPGNGPWSLLTARTNVLADELQTFFKIKQESFTTWIFLGISLALIGIILYIFARKNGTLTKKSFSLLLPALLAGCLVQISYYNATGYQHTRNWYWVAEMLVLLITGSLIVSEFFEFFDKRSKTKFISIGLAAASVGLLVYAQARFLVAMSPMTVTEGKEAAYLADVKGLEKYSDENSRIGMIGGGNIAYFVNNRTIVNLDGLINSVEYFSALKNGNGAKFLDNLKLDYVYGKPYILLETDPYRDVFLNRLDEVGYIRGAEGFTLYNYLINP